MRLWGGLLMLLLVCSCKCTDPATDKARALTAPEKLEGVLPASAYNAMAYADSGKLFKVEKSLIEGTTDEYSNKSIFTKELSDKELKALIAQLNSDLAYDWPQFDKGQDFTAHYQLALKSANGSVNLLIDMQKGLVSYINLDGQQLLPVTKDTQEQLKKLIH